MSVCPWTQFCPELPLLNHSPFCDQNLLYENALVGGMITFSDSSSVFLAAYALPMFRQQRESSTRKIEEKARRDPVKSHRPDLPIYGPGKNSFA